MIAAPATNPTIFLRMRQADESARELAWSEFHDRYAPMIKTFVRRLGLFDEDADDVVQDVMIGFFSRSPTFRYEPDKGRFRGYLKVCAHHAASRRLSHRARSATQPASRLDDVAIDHLWEDIWEAELLTKTLAEVRDGSEGGRTFSAFEQYVMFERPAEDVAAALGMHVNSVYRAKDEIVRRLQQRLAERRAEMG